MYPRVQGLPASPGRLAQPEHILTDLPAAYPSLTSQFTVDALLPSVDPLMQRIQEANDAQEQTAKEAINSMKARSLEEERKLTGLEREDDTLRGESASVRGLRVEQCECCDCHEEEERIAPCKQHECASVQCARQG